VIGIAIAATTLVPAALYASSTLLPWPGLFDVSPGSAVWRVGAGEVALTFDDGPDPERTPQILDALGHAGVHATFFLIGSRATACAALVRRIVAEGHVIGNHTRDHGSLVWRSDAVVEQAISRAQQNIFDACGVVPDLVRPPFGRRDATFYRVASRLRLTPVFWSRDTFDWLGVPAALVASRLENARSGDVVLMHDGLATATGTLRGLQLGLARISSRGGGARLGSIANRESART
jgi:peptidoglycan/xylan/chitin deacetylase (PgdA/CDA1 family)